MSLSYLNFKKTEIADLLIEFINLYEKVIVYYYNLYYYKNMERKEKIIRFLSQAAEEKKVEEEGIGLLSPDGYHYLGTTFFI